MIHSNFQIIFIIILKVILNRCQERISIIDSINKVPSNNGIVTQRAIITVVDIICPSIDNHGMIFPIPCERTSDCKVFGNGLICCDKKCLSGIGMRVNERHLHYSNSEEKTQQNSQLQKNKSSKLSCPPSVQTKSETPGLFSITCTNTANCEFLGANILCCEKKCAKGIADLKHESSSVTVVSPRQESNTILVCPANKDFRMHLLPIFNIPCRKDGDCDFLGKNIICCNKKCINAVVEQKIDIAHTSRFFGLVDTICPRDAIAEALEVKLCQSDLHCGGRICCPDKNGKNYCRTPTHSFDKIPGSKQFEEPIKNLVSFMQCTAPPPPLIDIFPKACRNNFDCFPNLCCQENGKKYCRPPKKSFLAAVVKRLGTFPAAKSFITRIAI